MPRQQNVGMHSRCFSRLEESSLVGHINRQTEGNGNNYTDCFGWSSECGVLGGGGGGGEGIMLFKQTDHTYNACQ